MPKAENFPADLASKGRCHFTGADMRAGLGRSGSAARAAISGLAKKGRIATPRAASTSSSPRVAEPTDVRPRRVSSLPSWPTKDAATTRALSAGETHGAAHQLLQIFQVVLESNCRPVLCGEVGIGF